LINITLPERDKRNGIITSYKITLVNEIGEVFVKDFLCSTHVQWNNTSPSVKENTTSVLFSGLRAYFNHTVTIQAYTRKGLGQVQSAPIIARTGQARKFFYQVSKKLIFYSKIEKEFHDFLNSCSKQFFSQNILLGINSK